MEIVRNPTRTIRIGRVTIGGESPIAVQSMTATQTRDVDATVAQVNALTDAGADVVRIAVDNSAEADALLAQTNLLKMQPPKTLFRLRVVEIGLPLAMSCISILLTLRYPLTEARWREIKEALDKRRANEAI